LLALDLDSPPTSSNILDVAARFLPLEDLGIPHGTLRPATTDDWIAIHGSLHHLLTRVPYSALWVEALKRSPNVISVETGVLDVEVVAEVVSNIGTGKPSVTTGRRAPRSTGCPGIYPDVVSQAHPGRYPLDPSH